MIPGTLGSIAERIGGRVVGDAGVTIERVVAVDDADASSLTFATDARYLQAALASKSGAILTDDALIEPGVAYAKPLLAVPSARTALAQLLAALEPPRPLGPFVHPTAAVDPTAQIGAGVFIGAQVVIGARSSVGARSVLFAGAVIGDDVHIGDDATMHPRSYIADRCSAGHRLVLQAGAVVGSDGFGYVFIDGAFRKIPQIGTVELGDDVEIGSNTCIDRAQTGVTSIGNGVKIDNLVQIGHNCRIGNHSAMAAFVGLAGSTVIGDYVQLGGQSASKGHITIGSRATVAGGSHLWGDVAEGAFVSGRPAQNHRDEVRLQAYIRRLPKLFARLDELEKRRPESE